MVAELVRESLGFDTVIIRLLNERTQAFEPKAYVGPAIPTRRKRSSITAPRWSDYEQMVEPRFRVSRSYFLQSSAPATAGDGRRRTTAPCWSGPLGATSSA